MNPENENISEVVLILLGRDRMNQRQLAKKMGYDASIITRSLKDQRDWKVADLRAMARVFDVNIATFFRDAKDLVTIIRFRLGRLRLALA